MRCKLCGNELNGMLCPLCVYDHSQNREENPTLADDGKRPEALRAARKRRFEALSSPAPIQSSRQEPASAPRPTPEQSKRKALWLIPAAAALLAIVLLIGIGFIHSDPHSFAADTDQTGHTVQTVHAADQSSGQPQTANLNTEAAEHTGSRDVKVGLICIGDENDSFTCGILRDKDAAAEALEAMGLNVEWVVKQNISENSECRDVNAELAEAGCELIINTSFGYEDYARAVASDYPQVQFVTCGAQDSWHDELPNTHNAFAAIHEGRYLSGVVAGMKLQQLIDAGDIQPEEAVIGYVGSFNYSENISGYSAFLLGARRVCPSASMKVCYSFVPSSQPAEYIAARALCDNGCKLISQQTDSSGFVAALLKERNVYYISCGNDMIASAPNVCLTGVRIDWSVCFTEMIEAVAEGRAIPQDWCKGVSDGAVVLTDLNTDLIAPGTEEKLAKVRAGLKDGSIQIFDIETFTVNGQKLTHAYALDTDNDFVPDREEAVFDGAFHESYFQSVPYFSYLIDGIEVLE